MKQATRTAVRALRNVARSPLRAGLMVSLLAVGISLALIMFTVDAAFADRLDQIKARVGTDVTVRPAGSGGGGFFTFGGNDEEQPYLDEGMAETIAAVPHVTTVARTFQVFSVETDLEMAVPDLGGAGEAGRPAFPGGDDGTVLIPTTGTDAVGPLQLPGGGTATISQGRGLSAEDVDADVALIGQQLAEQNGLEIGSTFELQGTTIEVVGIYSSGTFFGDNGIYLSLATAQRLFEAAGKLSAVTAQVDSAENVDAVAATIRDELGTDVVDVTSSTDEYDQISGSMTSAKRSSRIALIAALVASIAVILFATALVTRQRVREIGILKAVGAGGWHVGLQFGVETLVVAVAAAVAGALVTFPTAQAVANGLVSSSSSNAFPGGDGGAVVVRIGGPAGALGDSVDVAVTPAIFVYAVLLALVLALLASAVPAWRVSRVRPAEVLRYE